MSIHSTRPAGPARLAGRATAIAAFAMWAGTAHAASCAELIAALDKAWQQKRVAVHEVSRPDQPLSGRPTSVRIGRTVYDASGGGDYERTEVGDTDPVLAMIKRDQKAGAARCEAAGSDRFRGGAVSKQRYAGQVMPRVTVEYTFWIAAANGLPVYHEVKGLGAGGYAWTYGDAVKDPTAKK